MPIITVCDKCGKKFRVDDKFAGKNAKCSGCGNRIVIGTATTSLTFTVEPTRSSETDRESSEPEAGSHNAESSPANSGGPVHSPIPRFQSFPVIHVPAVPTHVEPSVFEPSSKNCPFCGEQILINAVKCRHCNEMLDPSLRAASQIPPPAAPFQPTPMVFMPQTAVHVATHQQIVIQSPPFNHLLHFILTILTCGAWFPVWMLLWLLR